VQNKIIVADDSITVQKVIKLILSPRGYDVIAHNNGKDAFNSIQRNSPVVVIADATMPGMNGIELGEMMKKEAKEISSIPLILIHSSFEEIKPEDILRSGAKEKLSKPFEDKQLIELVDKYAAREDGLEGGETTWDMESFVRPEVPDMKNPIKTIVKHGGDIDIDIHLGENDNDEEPPIFKMGENEKIEELGIPDADKFTRPEEKEEIIVEEEAEFGPEVISDNEAKKLMMEFKIKENPDGTINFDEMKDGIEDATRSAIERMESLSIDDDLASDSDIGLWSEKYYEHSSVPAGTLTEETIMLDAGEEDVPSVDAKDVADDKALIMAITREVVEKMVKQMLPEIAERIIKEEIQKIVGNQ
jgi:CheY-like chemotaxis protein